MVELGCILICTDPHISTVNTKNNKELLGGSLRKLALTFDACMPHRRVVHGFFSVRLGAGHQEIVRGSKTVPTAA